MRALVSVVIPTRGRPEWVACAVRSALGQSYASLEVIVVIDGPDTETVRALLEIDDARLRVIVLQQNVGGAEARNEGVRAARGEWVAFLDDDDSWMPEKLEKQMKAVQVQALYPIISSRLVACSPGESRVLPRRLFKSSMHVADYLFCRKGFSYGDGMLQTSTLLTKRSLLLAVPFQKGLQRHQDWDWLLRVAQLPEVEIAMLPEALVSMRVAEAGGSVSQSIGWEASWQWAKTARPRMSAKAYSFFIATECVPRACKARGGPGVLIRLLWESLRYGRPTLRQMVLFFLFCAIPERGRRKLRGRRKQRQSQQKCGELAEI